MSGKINNANTNKAPNAQLAALVSPHPRSAASQVRPPAALPADLAADAPRPPQHFASSGKDKQIAVDSDVRAMAVASHTVWMAHADGNISVCKTRTAEPVCKLSPYQGRAWSMLSVCVDGVDYVWVGLSNGDIEVYTAASYAPQSLLSRHTGGVYCLAEFSGFVFSGSNDFEIMQWDATKRLFVRQLSGHTNYVRSLFAEGGLLISGSNDHTVRVWNIANGKNVATGRFHEEGVGCMVRVGQHMWSGDESGTIIVWALETMNVVDTMSEHTGRITSMKKVGTRVYSGAGDTTIIVWDALTRQLIATLTDHRGWINAMVCPAQLSRYYMWTAAADGTVKCWHHDEYKVMSNDAERFDDMRWFHTEHNPYKDLNICLSNELKTALEKADALKSSYYTDTEVLRNERDKAQTVANKLLPLEGSLGSAQDRLSATIKEFEASQEVVSQKEKELRTANDATMRLTKENGVLRVENQKLKAELEETKRKLELTEIQKSVAEDATKKLHGDDVAARVLSPLIIRSESDAATAAAKLFKQLEDVVRLNEAFREEILRYKALLGIHTPTVRVGDGGAADGGATFPSGGAAGTGGGNNGATKVVGGVPQPPAAVPLQQRGVVPVGDGYVWRGAHFPSTTVKSYINDRYYNDRVLFHNGNSARPLSPRQPASSSNSCKCAGSAPRRMTTK